MVLIVEDDPAIRATLRVFFRSRGFSVRTASDGIEAEMEIRESRIALALVDARISGIPGQQVVRQLRRLSSSRKETPPFFPEHYRDGGHRVQPEGRRKKPPRGTRDGLDGLRIRLSVSHFLSGCGGGVKSFRNQNSSISWNCLVSLARTFR